MTEKKRRGWSIEGAVSIIAARRLMGTDTVFIIEPEVIESAHRFLKSKIPVKKSDELIRIKICMGNGRRDLI
jgi:hypothetical protein